MQHHPHLPTASRPLIGVFDSGYGGLTILREIVRELPGQDFLYLGDNARSPYGTRSFDTIYQYTLQAVKYLFSQGCGLVVLACNTASAKALRNIQQLDLPHLPPDSRMLSNPQPKSPNPQFPNPPDRRVLGIIRPTTEVIGQYSKTGHIGILATSGTVKSESYVLEINRLWPNLTVHQQACPMWVPLVENGELDGPGARYFVRKHIRELLRQSAKIDTVLLACTHYPLLLPLIRSCISPKINIIEQGTIAAKSLDDYLCRHPRFARKDPDGPGRLFFQTTGDPADFNEKGTLFFGSEVRSEKVEVVG